MLTPRQLALAISVLTALAILTLVALLVSTFGCSPQYPIVWQEPVVRWTRLPRSGNPVALGGSIASVDSQAEAIAYIDSVVAGRLPGVRFYLVKYPCLLPDNPGVVATSYRVPELGLIVLSHWGTERPLPPVLGTWSVGDVPWEVDHMAAGTGDDGKPFGRHSGLQVGAR